MISMIRDVKGDTEIRSPNCGKWQPLEKYRAYTVNPHYMTELTPVLQCQADVGDSRVCMHIFAPTALALKLRTDMLAGIETGSEDK